MNRFIEVSLEETGRTIINTKYIIKISNNIIHMSNGYLLRTKETYKQLLDLVTKEK